jgi:hypothetical protein
MKVKHIFSNWRKGDYIAHILLFVNISFVVLCLLIPEISKYLSSFENIDHKWFGMKEEDKKNISDSDFLEKLPLLSMDNELAGVLNGDWEFMPKHYGISRLLLSIDRINDSKVNVDVVIYVQKKRVSKNIEGDINNSCITLASSIKDPIFGKVFTKIYILKINTKIYLLPSAYIDLFRNSTKNHDYLDMVLFYKYNVDT